MNEVPSESNNQKELLKQQRLDQWKQDMQTQFGSLLEIAASLHAEMKSAKTTTKRNYFKKKFDKVSKDIKMLGLMVDNLDNIGSITEDSSNVVE